MLEHCYLTSTIQTLEYIKQLGEKSIKQVNSDDNLHWSPDAESNTIAVLVKHIVGNIRSRWTNTFTEDGEKANRNRPLEFAKNFKASKIELLELWNDGWNHSLKFIKSLKHEDLLRTIYIRKEPHLLLRAIQRHLSHCSMHVGQIMFLAKQIESKNWKTLSIPKDKEVFDYKKL